MDAPGQNSGQPGLGWDEYLDLLVAERGSLAAVAAAVAEHRGYVEELTSVERGLRRLRGRGHQGGGVWGIRLLQTFGMPRAVETRVRWMGHYHGRFTDLPASICEELLGVWDRPPVSESPARIWVKLGQASVALRRRKPDLARDHLDQARLHARQSVPAARAELALVEAYACGRTEHEARTAALERAALELASTDIEENARACLFARLVDQRAYELNKPRRGEPDHEGALALYRQIPADGPLFARCRRHNGEGWSLLRLGDRGAAARHARLSVQYAGDAGSLRLRAMALNLLAESVDAVEAAQARTRAAAIAHALEDEALAVRIRR